MISLNFIRGDWSCVTSFSPGTILINEILIILFAQPKSRHGYRESSETPDIKHRKIHSDQNQEVFLGKLELL